MHNLQLHLLKFPLVILLALAYAGWLYGLIWSTLRHLHYLQLEDYSPRRLARFTSKHWRKLLPGWDLIGLVIVIVSLLIDPAQNPNFRSNIELIGIVIWGVTCVIRGELIRRELKAAKKQLSLTPRAQRILILSVIMAVGSSYLWIKLPPHWQAALIILVFTVTERFASLWLSLSVIFLAPYEKFSQRRYLADAHRILAEFRPLVIGITGSYGKTGVKELLSAMLSRRFNIYRPPGSYNTLMGVTRAIREGLRPYNEMFVVEMGAYHEGSIARLCELVRPTHGLITTIGVQHLERFGSQTAIQRAKGELIRALPPDGTAVLNADDPLCREIAEWHKGDVRWFSMEQKSGSSFDKYQPATVTASRINITIKGSDFDLIFPDSEVVRAHLSLLGRSAIANATAAATMADRLGVSHRDIALALESIPFVRHRLEPRTGENGITVIDDAFNSNPIGARDALEVLSVATSGRRILVTPGMIELGELEESANFEFGRQAAESCDLVVLIGVKRIEPIRQGLISAGFPDERIWVEPTLKQGLSRLQTYLQPNDTMLLENDLPDQYAGL